MYAALSGLTKMQHLVLQGFGVSCPANAESPGTKHTNRFLLVWTSSTLTLCENLHCLRECVSVSVLLPALTSACLQNLVGVLDNMAQLNMLSLLECPLPEEQAEVFAAALSRRKALTTVQLDNCDLVSASVQAIATSSSQAIARNLRLLPRMREVWMPSNAIGDPNSIRAVFASSMATLWEVQGNSENCR